MVDVLVDFIGLLGGIVLSISFIPQIRRMWSERRNEFNQISLMWIIITLFGGTLYLIFGLMLPNWGIIILNLVANASMVLMLLIYLGVWRKS
jgi:uncharacterized protein with PQ loop repeat